MDCREAKMESPCIIQASERVRVNASLTMSSPNSPENAKPVVVYANAPSPRTLPRSVSRTSDESVLSKNNVEAPSTDMSLNDDATSEPSHVEGFKSRPISRPASWNWEYVSEQVGSYDIPTRRARIDRYREKRKQLSFNQVRYSARSNICQKRQRIGGRFVKTETIIRADKAALMHPNTAQRTPNKEVASGTGADPAIVAVAELMVGMSKRLSSASSTSNFFALK